MLTSIKKGLIELSEKVSVPAWFDQWAKEQKAAKAYLDENSQLLYLLRRISSSETANGRVLTAAAKVFFIKAVLDGYAIEPPKYLLPMAGTTSRQAAGQLYAGLQQNGTWVAEYFTSGQAKPANFYVTQAQLSTAPEWVKAIQPVVADELA